MIKIALNTLLKFFMNNIIEKALKIYIFFVIILAFFFGFDFFKIHFLTNKFLYHSDFYINYECGFIRRGIDGQIIYFLSSITSVNPKSIQQFYNLVFFLIFIFLIVNFFIKKRIPYYLIFSTGLLLIFIMFIRTGLRKDHLMIVYFFLLIEILKKSKNQKFIFICLNGVIIIATLSHEIFFLISFFPTIFYLNKYKFNKSSLNKALYLIPSFFVFLIIVLYYSGSQVEAHKILESWKALDIHDLKFSTGLFDKVFYIWTMNYTFYVYISIVINILLQALFIYFITKILRKKEYQKLFILQYFVCILLCIIAIDYSRWIFFTNFTILISVFSVSKEQIFDTEFNKPKILKILVCYLILGIPYAIWSVKSYILSTPLIIPYNIKLWMQGL